MNTVTHPSLLFVKDQTVMVGDWSCIAITEWDLQSFERFVPEDHFLRQAAREIPWNDFQETLASYYSPDQGRPSESLVLMLKLEYLCYHYRLSDRQVIARAETDLAFRFFLNISYRRQLPDHSSLSRFRARLKGEGFLKLFDELVAMARQKGLVRDRLRLKDASHIFANVHIPTSLSLVAQTRDRLLAAAQPFDPERVAGEKLKVQLLRKSTADQPDSGRLLARVVHLHDLLAWIDELPAPAEAVTDPAWQKLIGQRQLAHKILDDQEDPAAGDKTRSSVDPEARRCKHGEYYDGYLLDITMDADSELITQLNVLPANGQEARDATELVRREEAAHGNDVEALSIDGIGFHGPMLRELEDPEGLDVKVFVPPKDEPATGLFTPQDFVENREAGTVTCPAGQTSSYRKRGSSQQRTEYRFQKTTCASCPLVSKCMKHPPTDKNPLGRSVSKNDHEAEYTRARERAKTAEYESVRSEHSKVERKLGEVMNRHGGRRARYWGQAKVLIQSSLACIATNVKRMVRLASVPTTVVTGQS